MRKSGLKWKWPRSLLVQYLVLILGYVVIMPFVVAVFYANFGGFLERWQTIEVPEHYQTKHIEERTWEAARRVVGKTDAEKTRELEELRRLYPDGGVYWVDEQGRTRWKQPAETAIPDEWSRMELVTFMKERYDGDPFTVVATLGERGEEGFFAVQMPRSLTTVELPRYTGTLFMSTLLIVAVSLFVFLSWLFFSRVRKRLLHLQRAMRATESGGLPQPVPGSRWLWRGDEVNELEQTFNGMVEQLRESRAREKEEERLRKQLIASLSHDLRTPLTTLRGHAYSLRQEALSERGRRSVEVIDDKVDFLDRLIDNLLSFTLLSAGRYPFHPERRDVLRLLRAQVAAWYPALEKEGFEIDVELPDAPVEWTVDAQWFQRIWDNLLQNALRHAQSGQYVGLSVETYQGKPSLLLRDKGPGMAAVTAAKGAGMGLSIVQLMVQEMGLVLHVESSAQGTTYILQEKKASGI